MRKSISKGFILVVLSLLMAPTMYAQTALKAYSFLPGNMATNGQTKLWASIGGYGKGVSAAGNTTLKPGVLAVGLSTETVLGLLEDLEKGVVIYQNYNANEVSIKNTTNYKIESARVINTEGRTLSIKFEKTDYGNSNFKFSSNNLAPGVYLIQVSLNGLPITKKFLVK